MVKFFFFNGFWSQLVELGQIDCCVVILGEFVLFCEDLSVEVIFVFYCDEFIDIFVWIICGFEWVLLFFFDIDKWECWDQDISELFVDVDYVFFDVIFFGFDEFLGCDMFEIFYLFIVEFIECFQDFVFEVCDCVYFLYFNYFNFVAMLSSDVVVIVCVVGYYICVEGVCFFFQFMVFVK